MHTAASTWKGRLAPLGSSKWSSRRPSRLDGIAASLCEAPSFSCGLARVSALSDAAIWDRSCVGCSPFLQSRGNRQLGVLPAWRAPRVRCPRALRCDGIRELEVDSRPRLDAGGLRSPHSAHRIDSNHSGFGSPVEPKEKRHVSESEPAATGRAAALLPPPAASSIEQFHRALTP